MATVNYTDQESITIDDINATPISTGYNYTFGNVFGALNNIIKAIINKFSEISNEISTFRKGKTGAASWNILLETDAHVVKTINIDDSHYLTHGYIIINGRMEHLTQLRPSLDENNTYGNMIADGYKKLGTANVSYELTHDNNATQLKVTFRRQNAYYPFKYDGYKIEYELY